MRKKQMNGNFYVNENSSIEDIKAKAIHRIFVESAIIHANMDRIRRSEHSTVYAKFLKAKYGATDESNLNDIEETAEFKAYCKLAKKFEVIEKFLSNELAQFVLVVIPFKSQSENFICTLICNGMIRTLSYVHSMANSNVRIDDEAKEYAKADEKFEKLIKDIEAI